MIHTEIIVNKEYCGFNPVQFGFENCCPSHSFGPAVRSHWLLHYVVSGFGFFRRDGKQYNLSPGEVFVIPPYLETYYQADAKNPWYYIWIGFTADAELEHLFSPPVLSVAGMGDIFEDMRRCKGMENGRSAFLSAKLWELASLIMAQSGPQLFFHPFQGTGGRAARAVSDKYAAGKGGGAHAAPRRITHHGGAVRGVHGYLPFLKGV